MDILALMFLFLLWYPLTQDAAGVTVMVYYTAVHQKAGLCVFQQSPQASVTFIDDISVAFKDVLVVGSFMTEQMASEEYQVWIKGSH